MNWIFLLFGFAFGGVAGLICGFMVADEWWRKKSRMFDRVYAPSDKDANLLYEIEKREDKQV